MRKSLALLAIVLAAGQAAALDMRFPPPAYPAPLYPPPGFVPALPQWTGCYVGGNVGGAWAKINETSSASGTISTHPAGLAGGGQIGCDVQFAEWVFGIRDMLDATNLRSSTSFPGGSINTHTNWFDTLTAREGYLVQPNVLIYARRRGLDQDQRDALQCRRHANRQPVE